MLFSQILKGHLYEKNTGVVVNSVNIKVSATNETAYTDKKGYFQIRAKVNDLLIISAFGFKTDTLLVTDTRLQEIYLSPREYLLKEVKVNAGNVARSGGFSGYDPDFHGQTITKQFDEKGRYKGGVVFRVWYWKKDEKKRAKREQTIRADAAYQKRAEVFCSDTILKYLPLKKEDVNTFIARYSPGMEEFMSPGFNLALYLNQCYKAYKQGPLADTAGK